MFLFQTRLLGAFSLPVEIKGRGTKILHFLYSMDWGDKDFVSFDLTNE